MRACPRPAEHRPLGRRRPRRRYVWAVERRTQIVGEGQLVVVVVELEDSKDETVYEIISENTRAIFKINIINKKVKYPTIVSLTGPLRGAGHTRNIYAINMPCTYGCVRSTVHASAYTPNAILLSAVELSAQCTQGCTSRLCRPERWQTGPRHRQRQRARRKDTTKSGFACRPSVIANVKPHLTHSSVVVAGTRCWAPSPSSLV